MSEKNVGIKPVLIVIKKFYHIYLWCVEEDYCKPLLRNSKFPSYILSD